MIEPLATDDAWVKYESLLSLDDKMPTKCLYILKIQGGFHYVLPEMILELLRN